jgi:allantoate deiminase
MPGSELQNHYGRCQILADYSESSGSLCRTFLSPAHRQAAGVIADWMRQAGLTVEQDDWGNVFGRSRADGPSIIIGSHYDTVPNAGAFDGVLGIVAGLAAIELIGPQVLARLPFALEVAAFSEEEGIRFPATFLGSRAAWGLISPEDFSLQDADGLTLGELMAKPNPPARYRQKDILAYLEPHIEQGPVLENSGVPLAAVTAVAGQMRFRMSLEGVSGHAGTCPMPLRKDALAGLADWMLFAESFARKTPDLVATVGTVEIPGAAPNVIPGLVNWTLDLRHPEETTLNSAREFLLQQARQISRQRGLRFTFTQTTDQPPVQLNASLCEKISAILPPNTPKMISGAGHDAVIFAPRVPTALLFVRCRGGLSHHPDEHVSLEDFIRLVETLRDFILAEKII